MKNKRIILIILGIVLILLIPLLAGWPWNLFDFVIAGILLIAGASAFELIVQKVNKSKNKTILVLILTSALVLIWADLAVGIFNIPGFSGD